MFLSTFLASLCLVPVLAIADLLGPRFAPPLDITSDNGLPAKAWGHLTDIFNGHINGSSPSPLLTGIENITFSLGAFSIHDASAASALQYHYTAPEIENSVVGVKKVDADSVYRFASVSKLFTAYAGMVALTDEGWGRPFTKIFPSLAESDGHEGLTQVSQWENVTPLSLAAHISGVTGNSPPFAIVDSYLSYQFEVAAGLIPSLDPMTLGLPPVSNPYPYFSPFCKMPNSNCTGDRYVKQAQSRFPTYQTWASPTYSNHGYMLLGLAIAQLARKPLDDVYREALFEPLNMTSSNSTDPLHLADRTVVPGGNLSFVFTDSGLGAASGGIFSTLNDMAKFSTSILNSTLLTEEKTRKWMKPLSHTASLNYSVGAGWEILRYLHPVTGVVTDLYTKLGDSGMNGGAVVLIPDYGAGFNCLVASSRPERSDVQKLVFDAVVREFLPALEAQAAAEAQARFNGTYVPEDKTLNSSLTLAVKPSVGGLWVTEWISNSSNVLKNQQLLFSAPGGLRLLPTIHDADGLQYAFRIRGGSNQTVKEASMSVGPFTGTAKDDWIYTGQLTYAGEPIDLAIFDLDKSGDAIAVNLPAFNLTLERLNISNAEH